MVAGSPRPGPRRAVGSLHALAAMKSGDKVRDTTGRLMTVAVVDGDQRAFCQWWSEDGGLISSWFSLNDLTPYIKEGDTDGHRE